jgi:hypothetical protein
VLLHDIFVTEAHGAMSEKRKPIPLMANARSAGEVLLVSLRLGLTSFGGPVAHLGYFREEYVVRWGQLTSWAPAGSTALWWRPAFFFPRPSRRCS